MDTSLLRISLFQMDILWEDPCGNLTRVEEKIKSVSGQADIVALPEMFSTGFTMRSESLAESNTENTICTLKIYAHTYNTAIAGSYICEDKGQYYNRAFFLTPTGKEYYYDKRHLFRMGEENEHFHPGTQRCIFNYRGWNIHLAVCYDLRFPVWLRNVQNEYDLLLIVANWPASRQKVWENLLCARSIENQCYVCGVNRVGTDGNNLKYIGQSVLLDARGEKLSTIPMAIEAHETIEIEKDTLEKFRKKFPVWKDADKFELHF